MHSDPIADMATRMRNAQSAGHLFVLIPSSKIKEAILSVLLQKGFIEGFSLEEKGKFLRVEFKKGSEPFSIKRVSKPGQRIYKKAKEILPVRRGKGISVVSTSLGMLAGYEAYTKGIGGEVLLEVY
jgi:small subunit ribosomal protein S8